MDTPVRRRENSVVVYLHQIRCIHNIKEKWKARLEALTETVGYWMKNNSGKLIKVVGSYY